MAWISDCAAFASDLLSQALKLHRLVYAGSLGAPKEKPGHTHVPGFLQKTSLYKTRLDEPVFISCDNDAERTTEQPTQPAHSEHG